MTRGGSTRFVAGLAALVTMLLGAAPVQAAHVRKIAQSAEPVVMPDSGPHPGLPQYSGDWAAGCDNISRCEATALHPDEGGDAEGNSEGVLLQILRNGGPGGEVTLRARSFDALPAQISLLADGREIARLSGEGKDEATLVGGPALVAVQAMASAVTFELRGVGRKKSDAPLIATPSSVGLADTLRFIDARQGRTGTATAFAARGPHGDAHVPAAPATPVVPQVPSPDADSAPGLSEGELAAAKKLGVCDPNLMAGAVQELVPLDSAAALLLLPCEAGEYNVSAVPLVATGTPGSRTLSIARFDFAPGFTGEPGKPPLVVNALWDARRGILSSLAKGRGSGDCGAAEDYVWDGTRFRLIESRAMHVCRGAWDWIRLWTAVPKRAAVRAAG